MRDEAIVINVSEENALEVRENHLSVVNRHLPARTDVFLFDNGNPLPLSPARETAAEPVSYAHCGEISLAKGERRRLTIVYVLVPTTAEPPSLLGTRLSDEWLLQRC